METQYQVIAMFIFAFLATTNAINQHLICKSVNDVFSDRIGGNDYTGNETVQSHIGQGKPGKKGPVGPRGLPGSRGVKGDAGYVDYNNISDIVERKVCEGLTIVATNVNKLQTYIGSMQRTLEELRCSISGLVYNGTCYSTPHFSVSNDLSYGEANQTCLRLGRKMAEIHDRTQQQILEDFIRSKIPSSLNEIHPWIGMSYDRDTNSIRYKSGEEIPANRLVWWPTHPRSASSRHMLVFGVMKSGDDGIWSTDGWKANGVICEKPTTL